jgi:predicted NBD/HSP70 family sugar kinase
MTLPTLAIDLGGTKTLVALVEGGAVRESRCLATVRDSGAEVWMETILAGVRPWRGSFERAGIAVTGTIRAGRWSALNPATLPVPPDYPLVHVLERGLGVPVTAANDAQAAAWGEYRYGAGQGCDMVFLTISTGIGGGLVSGGRLLKGRSGLAGHIGQTVIETPDGIMRLEDVASGGALARAAAARGIAAQAVFDVGLRESRAEELAGPIIRLLTSALRSLQVTLDPDCFVIGGGLGLAEGFLSRLSETLADLPPALRPNLRAAALGAHAGVIGMADLVLIESNGHLEVTP